jgi:hypothetical protein
VVGRLARWRTRQHVLFHQRLRQLLQEEGIALRLGEQRRGQRRRDGLLLEHRLDDLYTVLGRERRHGELGGVGLLQPRRPIPRAVGAQDQEGRAGESRHQRGDKLFRGGVAPVQVFHRQNEGVLLTAREPELPQRRKSVRLQRLRTAPRHLPGGRRHPQQMQQSGGRCVRCQPHRLEPAAHLCSDGVSAVGRGDATVRPQPVEHGEVGRGAAIGETVAFQVCHPGRGQPLAPLREEPRLAHAGLPHDPHTLPPTTSHLRQERVQRGQFRRTPDEWGARPQLPLGAARSCSASTARVRSPTTAAGSWVSPIPPRTIRPVCSPRHTASGSSVRSPLRDAANRWCSPHAANRARRA